MAKTPICNSQIFFWKHCNRAYRVLQGTGYYNVLQSTGLYWSILGGKGVQGGTVATAGYLEVLWGTWGVVIVHPITFHPNVSPNFS